MLKKIVTTAAALGFLCMLGCGLYNPFTPQPTVEQGSMSLTMNLSGTGVSSGSVTISQGNESQSQPIVITNNSGSVTFGSIKTGNWQIKVELFAADGSKTYEGEGSATVKHGQKTTATIVLSPSSGDLEIIVIIATPTPAPSVTPVPQGLIFWNKLGSEYDVKHSMVGPSGNISGGTFTSDDGLFHRNAYEARPQEAFCLKFPLKSLWPSERGCVEFWARLKNYPADLRDGGSPIFMRFDGPNIPESDPRSFWEVHINSNDGNGGAGFCARPARVYSLATKVFLQYVNYSMLLGDQAAWHHYAVVWDKDGTEIIPKQIDPWGGYDTSIGYGTCETYIDGVKNSGWFKGPRYDLGYEAEPNGEYLLLIKNFHSQGNTQISNLKLWNFAKINFSDRFSE